MTVQKRRLQGRVLNANATEAEGGHVILEAVAGQDGVVKKLNFIKDLTTNTLLYEGQALEVPFIAGALDNDEAGVWGIDLPVTDTEDTDPTGYAWRVVVMGSEGRIAGPIIMEIPSTIDGPIEFASVIRALPSSLYASLVTFADFDALTAELNANYTDFAAATNARYDEFTDAADAAYGQFTAATDAKYDEFASDADAAYNQFTTATDAKYDQFTGEVAADTAGALASRQQAEAAAAESETSAQASASSATDSAQSASASQTSAGEAATHVTEATAEKDAAHTERLAAETARTGAETARTGSETARTGSETARDASVTAQSASEAARDASVTAKTGSETARDASVAAQGASETARDQSAISAGDSATSAGDSATSATASATARDASIAARTGSETARDASISAKDVSVTASTNSEASRQASEAAMGLSQQYRDTALTYRDQAAASAAGIGLPNGLAPYAVNVIANPDFAVDAADWSAGQATISRDVSWSETAGASLLVTTVTAPSTVSVYPVKHGGGATRYDATPGMYVRAVWRVRVVNACQLTPKCVNYDTGGTTGPGTINGVARVLNAGDILTIDETYGPLPANTVTVNPRIYINSSANGIPAGLTQFIQIDRANIMIGATADDVNSVGQFFTGADQSARWEGTARQSPSDIVVPRRSDVLAAIKAHENKADPHSVYMLESAFTPVLTNLAINPGAENNGGWIGNNAAIWNVTRDTSVFRSGTQSVRSTKIAGSTAGTQALSLYAVGMTSASRQACAPGDILTASVWLKPGQAGYQGHTNLAFYDAGGTVLLTVTGADLPTPVGTWTRVSVSGVAPANATGYYQMAYASTLAGNAADNDFVNADDAMVNAGYGLFDNFDPSVGPYARWQGTAHASKSDLLIPRASDLIADSAGRMAAHLALPDPHTQYMLENASDPVVNGLKDYSERKFSGASSGTNKSGALIIPITVSGTDANMLTVEVDLHAYNSQYVRAKMIASIYYRDASVGAMVGPSASFTVTNQNNLALSGFGTSWPLVRWVRSTTVGLVYLVIGDITDTWLLGNAEVTRVTSHYTGSISSVGIPQWVTTLPANDSVMTSPVSDSSGGLVGSGSPEGVFAANPGVEYTDKTSANGATKWTKMSGTGNTGWVVTLGDTGWRDVTTSLVNGWTANKVMFWRRNDNVEMRVENLSGAAKTADAFLPWQTGFRVKKTSGGNVFYVGSGAIPTTAISHHQSGYWQWAGGPTAAWDSWRYITPDAWPNPLPGIVGS